MGKRRRILKQKGSKAENPSDFWSRMKSRIGRRIHSEAERTALLKRHQEATEKYRRVVSVGKPKSKAA